MAGQPLAADRAPWVEPELPNLLANGDFESDTANWIGNGGAVISRDTAEKFAGSASLKIVHSSDSMSSAKSDMHTPVTPAKSTTVPAKIKPPVGDQFQLVMHLCTAVGYSSAQQTPAAVATGGWDTATRTVTIGADITRVIAELVKASA